MNLIEMEKNRSQGSKPTHPNVDWGAIERATRGQEDRLPKQSSNEVIAGIQRQVRAVKERTDRAIGEYKEPSRELEGKQWDIEWENGG